MTSRDFSNWMWGEALSMIERAERLQRQFFQHTAAAWEPPVDIMESPEDVRVQVALPGVPADAIAVALALRPLVDADIASGRLCAPFKVELKPQSAYYLVCPEVIAERPAVVAFRKWLLEQAK